MAKKYNSCCEYVRDKLKSFQALPHIGDAKEWYTSDLLTEIKPTDWKKGMEAALVCPTFGKFGHVFIIDEVRVLEDGFKVWGRQFVGVESDIIVYSRKEDEAKIVIANPSPIQEAEVVENPKEIPVKEIKSVEKVEVTVDKPKKTRKPRAKRANK